MSFRKEFDFLKIERLNLKRR